MTSRPRHIVPATQASAILPPSTLASTRMCPSILVMGSTTILAILISPPYLVLIFAFCGSSDSCMSCYSCQCNSCDTDADLVGIGHNSRTGNFRHSLVKRIRCIPVAGGRARYTAMSGHYRPAGAAVPPDCRAVLMCHRALAAHLIKTPALSCAFVAPFLDELASIKMRTPFTVVVDKFPKSKFRTSVAVEFRQRAKGEEMHDRGCEVFAVHRASCNVDDRSTDYVLDANTSGRVRAGCGQSAVTCAVSYCNISHRACRNFLDDLDS